MGVGGLIQAYRQCAEETIKGAKLKQLIDYNLLQIRYPYQIARQVKYLVSRYNGKFVSSDYDVAVKSKIKIPQNAQQKFENELTETSSGQVQISEVIE